MQATPTLAPDSVTHVVLLPSDGLTKLGIQFQLDLMYRVTLVVAFLSWADFDLDVRSSCPLAQPVLPNSQLPKLSLADTGTSNSKSTQPR